jgi:penicillin-binding protein 1A
MYYGGMAYGVEAAAQTYFGKSATELDLAECALLAGLTRPRPCITPLPTWRQPRRARPWCWA